MLPNYERIMLPLLVFLKDKKEHSLLEAVEVLANEFELTEEERKRLLPSGTQTYFKNRLGWARTYLEKAKLLVSTKRAHFMIADRGLALLAEKPKEISAKFLCRYPEFVEFKTMRNPKEESIGGDAESEMTPLESLENAYQKISSELAKEVLAVVKGTSPSFFERLVVDLLVKMGYGGSRKDAGEALGKSGDGGIDGIVKEDKLGLDAIYIQAKRWDNPVPVKEVRDFTGALAAKKANKGIFITTSTFPSSVYEYISQVQYKIILIDGEALARLMIEYNVGLSVSEEYFVKKIDMDYFEEI